VHEENKHHTNEGDRLPTRHVSHENSAWSVA
jgi:hypothetical protein